MQGDKANIFWHRNRPDVGLENTEDLCEQDEIH